MSPDQATVRKLRRATISHEFDAEQRSGKNKQALAKPCSALESLMMKPSSNTTGKEATLVRAGRPHYFLLSDRNVEEWKTGNEIPKFFVVYPSMISRLRKEIAAFA